MNMRISVIGTGYLGATHAACLAELGFEVLGVDNNPAKVAMLSAGAVPFSEPGLETMVARHVRTGRLRFTSDLGEATRFADVHFICVGTPQAGFGMAADLSAVFAVARELAKNLTRDCLIIGKSTVPVGTADMLAFEVARLVPPGVTATLAWNPEFLREGHGVEDTLRPDRLVFGVSTPEAEGTLRTIYQRPIAAGAPVHVTDLATAELAKVAANAFLATKISFINAMAEVSERSGADVVALADILGDDDRIGRRFLDAGVGFGGGCLPKDVRAFSARAAELGAHSVTGLLREVDAINLRARQRTVDLANELCGSGRQGRRRIAVLGAAFKPLSDDVRDSPALHVADRLHRQGAEVRVYDPEANINARSVFPQLLYVASAEAALTGADLVLHLTDWPEFADLDPNVAGRLVRARRIVDGRNRLDRDRWRRAGWTFRGIGRREEGTLAPAAPTTASSGPSDHRDSPFVSGEGRRGRLAVHDHSDLLERT
ncbi:MAG: UDP-glucose dehydrogenase family protein [Nocardioidaceae bacterium]